MEGGEGAATERNVEESGVRRSTRNRQRPDYLVEKVSVAKDSAEEPATVKEAMEAEMQSLQADGELMVGVYVDDIVIGGKSEKKTKEFKLALGEKFDVKYLGRLHYFLGMKIGRDYRPECSSKQRGVLFHD